MLKQISLIAIAIGVVTATLLIPATNGANAALRLAAPQPILSAGHDQILRSSTGILLKAGAVSINVPLPQREMLQALEK
jgi:hypothetical protein